MYGVPRIGAYAAKIMAGVSLIRNLAGSDPNIPCTPAKLSTWILNPSFDDDAVRKEIYDVVK